MTPTHLIVLGAALLAALPASAATCKAASGPTLVPVVELYTSEGCSSCPPADKWFSSLDAKSAVVPLAFHVDYWDYIGWRDRFADPQYSRRQREEVQRQGGRVVYTPQILLDGQDWQPWVRSWELQSGVAKIAQRAPGAAISLEAAAQPGTLDVSARVSLADAARAGDALVYLAVTENRLSSHATAGENSGVTLNHDHVVREWIGPLHVAAGGRLDVRKSLALAGDWKASDLALVAFAQDRRTGATLQALSLQLCSP